MAGKRSVAAEGDHYKVKLDEGRRLQALKKAVKIHIRDTDRMVQGDDYGHMTRGQALRRHAGRLAFIATPAAIGAAGFHHLTGQHPGWALGGAAIGTMHDHVRQTYKIYKNLRKGEYRDPIKEEIDQINK